MSEQGFEVVSERLATNTDRLITAGLVIALAVASTVATVRILDLSSQTREPQVVEVSVDASIEGTVQNG